ncbi:MAG: hypothetical protein KDK78_09505, partial [Chlamydiia bacterium]|nr:hypothetical protein [Chlamydiia bacterium]
ALPIWMVEGRYVEYCTIVKNCGLQKEVEIQLLDLGREFWEGKEDEVDIVHRFHKALITVSPDQTRILTRAGTNLFQRRRVASIERADENLRLIRDGFNIAFQLIKRDMDERARYEVDDMARLLRGQRQPVDTKKTAQKYKPGTLGYKLDRLINRIAKRVADHLSPEYFAQKLEEAVQRCEHDKETLCFIQRMLDNKEVFCGVAAHLGVLGLEVIHGFLTRTLESFLLTILAHDASDLLQDCVKALHQSMSIYYREKDKIGGYQYKHPLPLLKALHEQDGERYSLHPNVPVSTEKARIHRADQDYFVHHLIPKLKELVFPNSTLMDEIVSAFIQGDAGWEDAFGVKERPAGFVKAAFSGIDHTLSLIAGEFIIETMEEYLDPTKLNRMVVEWIEEQWQEELEDAEKDGDPKRLAFLRSKQMEYQRYLRANTGTEEQRTYVHATLAIRYAVALWAPNPYPGTHVLVQATLLQLLELIQSKPMIKNLIYHVLDKCFDHLLSEPKQAAADLNRPIESIRRRHGGDGPFKNTCMREMASLVLDMVRIGSNHLPAETSYAGWGTILIGRIVAWFSESRVIEMIREKLEDLWVNKFELSFPGLLALALDKLHSWIKDPEEGLEAMLKEGKTPKLKF